MGETALSIANSMNTSLRFTFAIVLFLFVLGCVAFTINEKNQSDFNLQQIGVESLVSRHTFALEGSSVPQLQPLGDTFHFQGHVYAIKQPGQFVLGAMVYSLLDFVGITYERAYGETASLVTLLTSGVLLAAIAVALYLVSQKVTHSHSYSSVIALMGSLGTLLFPYAGVAHHDVQATALIFISWTILFYIHKRKDVGVWAWVVAGLLLGFSLFISMLPLVVVLSICIGVLIQRDRHTLLPFVVGTALGVLPVFGFNAVLFGGPLAFPNSISGTTDTTSFLSASNMFEKLDFYLFSPTNSLFLFAPILLLACIGFFFLKREQRSIVTTTMLVSFGHLLYISSIETVGHAQYGPRYLLPVLPFLALGLIGLYSAPRFLRFLAVLAGAISILIMTMGALGGVMYQTLWIHPFPQYLESFLNGTMPENPLRYLGVILIVGSIVVLLADQLYQRKEGLRIK